MKYIALDIGNVLCNVNFDNLLRDLSDTFNLSLDDALYFLNRNQKLHDLGLTNMQKELHYHLKVVSQVTVDRIMKSWNSSIYAAPAMLGFFNKLIAENDLQVALLSNIGHEHADMMPRILGLDGFFDHAIKHFSCDVGARKPTLLYYQSFLMEHPEFEGCLYVDDVKENLEAGRRFGFQPYYFALDKMDIVKELPEIEKLILATDDKPQKNPRWH